MEKCTGCGLEKELVHGKRCKECRSSYGLNRRIKIRRKRECPICNSVHSKLTIECCTKCKLMNRHEKVNNCWNWRGKLNMSGYGNFQETKNGKKKDLMAHRESYRIFKGEIPSSLLVLHKCDNPKCINPDHLFLGTQKDNALDMFHKGRSAKQKLKIEDVKMIKKMFQQGIGNKEISQTYNVARCTISSIRIGLTWKHVKD